MEVKTFVCDNCKKVFVLPKSNCPNCGRRVVGVSEGIVKLVSDGYCIDTSHIRTSSVEPMSYEELRQLYDVMLKENNNVDGVKKNTRCDLNKQIMEAHNEIKLDKQEVSEDVQSKEKEVGKLEEEIIKLQEEKNRLREELDNKSESIKDIKSESNILQKEIKKLREQNKKTYEEYERLKSEYKECEDICADIKNRLEAKKKEIDKVNIEKAKYISLFEIQEFEYENIQKELKNLKSQLRYDEETVRLIEEEDFLKSPSIKESIGFIHKELETVEKKLARIIFIKEKINDTIQDAVIQFGNGMIDASDEVGGKL